MGTAIVVAIIAVAAFFAGRAMIRDIRGELSGKGCAGCSGCPDDGCSACRITADERSEEHTSELQIGRAHV